MVESSLISVVCKRMSEIWDTPPPTNRGPKTTFFGRLRNLTETLTAYIFGMKHDIDNRSSALATPRVSYIVPKCRELMVHKRLQTRPAFLPTLRKFCILLHCQASQTGDQQTELNQTLPSNG